MDKMIDLELPDGRWLGRQLIMPGSATQYKMGGPIGAMFFAVFMTSYTFYITLKVQTGDWNLFSLPSFTSTKYDILDLNVTIVVLLWFLAQCVLYRIPIGGKRELGVKLENGQQLEYRANAFFVLHVNIAVACLVFGRSLDKVSAWLIPILTSSACLCFMLSIFLYLKGSNSSGSNKNGNTGNVVYDWFMGRELNPRPFGTDLKYVMFRSGIIGWILLNTCNCAEYYKQHGTITPTMLLVAVLQYIYVADYFWYESGVIVSRDIVHEGLGYNILIQFLMIPFCFCVQTRYILTMDYNHDVFILIGIVCLYGCGYYIYRASNSEKNNFRKNPNDPRLAYLKTMPTSTGKKLLITGWWGRCRHPNYLGDLLMSSSYALATGTNHFIPYLGTVILVLLLLDREKQDNQDCHRKYGKDWDKYCTIVKYRIVPGLY